MKRLGLFFAFKGENMKRKDYRKKYYSIVTIVLVLVLLPQLIYIVENRKFDRELREKNQVWEGLSRDDRSEKKGLALAYNDLLVGGRDGTKIYSEILKDQAYFGSLNLPSLDWDLPIRIGEGYGLVHEEETSLPLDGLVRSRLSYNSIFYRLLPVNRLDSLRLNDRIYLDAYDEKLAYQVVDLDYDQEGPIDSNDLIIRVGKKNIYFKKTSYNSKVMEYDAELGKIYRTRKIKEYGLVILALYMLPLIFRREAYIEVGKAYEKKLKSQESRKNT